MKNMMLAAIPTVAGEAAHASQTNGWTYKGTPGNGAIQAFRSSKTREHEFRYAINVEETLEGFRQRFRTGDIFRVSSEICSVFLVPRELTFSEATVNKPSYHPNVAGNTSALAYDQMEGWWGESSLPADPSTADGFLCTGDNTREMPYNHIYPRVTTKSNTFRVHFTVQALKQVPDGRTRDEDYETWNERRDQVTGEYRGSALLERYIDPNDPGLPDFANMDLDSQEAVIDNYYRFRVLETKRFQP